MRTPLIAGNWKMNATRAEAGVLAGAVKAGIEHMEKIEVVMCPPTIWLAELAHHYVAPGQFEHLRLGAQNIHFEEKGTFTGETAPGQAKEVADYVLVGHSERTHMFGENPEIVAKKLHAAFDHDLKPILCIGEDVRDESSLRAMVHQLDHLVKGLSHEQIESLVVAYEPVWAISKSGVGTPATPEYAQEVIGTLRTRLSAKTRLIYGGSSNSENARGFLEQEDIDGLLPGNASLTAKNFLGMCQVAEALAHTHHA